MSLNFNEESSKPWFISRINPLVPHSWQIFEYKEEKAEYEPVGDYTLIDTSESADITEKKLINLTAIMNGRKPLIDFENLTETRVLYTIVSSGEPDETQVKIIFRGYDGSGVSKENAVLTIDKGVFDEENSIESDQIG